MRNPRVFGGKPVTHPYKMTSPAGSPNQRRNSNVSSISLRLVPDLLLRVSNLLCRCDRFDYDSCGRERPHLPQKKGKESKKEKTSKNESATAISQPSANSGSSKGKGAGKESTAPTKAGVPALWEDGFSALIRKRISELKAAAR